MEKIFIGKNKLNLIKTKGLKTIIDIGDPAIDRATSIGPYTSVSKGNPANLTGKITSVEIWAFENLSNCEVATFFVVSGNNLSTRDTHYIGSVTSGSKQTFSGLDISVQVGDYIGIYYTTGTLETDSDGGSGIWYKTNDHIPCIDVYFNFIAGWQTSVYGIGEALPPPPAEASRTGIYTFKTLK